MGQDSLIRFLLQSALALSVGACGGGGSPSGVAGNVSPSPVPTATPTPTASPTDASVSFLHVFRPDLKDAGQNSSRLLMASDGYFYATTMTGGVYECGTGTGACGTIYRISPSGQQAVLYSFGADVKMGFTPLGGLIQGKDGALYGVTASGGAYSRGGIYKMTLSGTYTLLYSFGQNPTDGASPGGELVQGADGSLYGITSIGGTNNCSQVPAVFGTGNCGTIFKFASDGTFSTIYTFGMTASDGVQPNGTLLLASDGFLYGTTQNGGGNPCTSSNGPGQCGSLFRVSTDGKLTTLHSFGTTLQDALAPGGALIEASDGAIYGFSLSGGGGTCGNVFGCGAVFKMTKAGSYSVIYSFAKDGRLDGYGPNGLIQGKDGLLYGTTGSGGKYSSDLNGTVFRMTLAGKKSIIYSFGPLDTNPSNPQEGVVQGPDGAFYGVLKYNGRYNPVDTTGAGSGAVYKLVP